MDNYFHSALLRVLSSVVIGLIGTWGSVHSQFHLISPTMSDTTSDLGSCPFCGTTISAEAVLIKYDADDETRVFAECRHCETPVQPE